MMVAAVSNSNTTPNRKISSRVATPQNPNRPPLLPSEADNNGPRRPKSREVTSRYLSSASSTTTTSSSATSSSCSSSSNFTNTPSLRRFPSPAVPGRVTSTPAQAPAVVKRSQSVERRRAATPRPGSPANAGQISAAAKLLVNSKRSLSVSFQGESFSVPINKTNPTPAASTNNGRKCTPERRKVVTPGKDLAENSRPTDKQRWPARSVQVNSLTRSVDFTSERAKFGGSGTVVRALQTSMIDEKQRVAVGAKLKPARVNDGADSMSIEENSDLTPTDTDSVSSESNSGGQECARGGPRSIVVPARFWQETNNRLRRQPDQPGSPVTKTNGLKNMGMVPPKVIGTKKLLNDSPALSPRGISASRGQSSPLRGFVRPASPSKNVVSSTSSPLRGTSPSRSRNAVGTTLTSNLSCTPSILSFASDARRGKVGENRILDAHQLRLLYNQHLQWRFANGRVDAALLVRKGIAEKNLYNAWLTIERLRHSVKSKQIELQLRRQNLKMYSILKEHKLYLDDWDSIDKDHYSSLCELIEALEATTLRLPVVGSARADILKLKDAICSAVDVMQAMASSICNLQTKVEHVNSLASELASITSDERASLDRCRGLLSTLTSMQMKDCSMRIHIIQLRGEASSLTTEV